MERKRDRQAPPRETLLIPGLDGNPFGLRTQNFFRDKHLALIGASKIIDNHQGSTIRVIGLNRHVLTLDDDYLAKVRGLDSEGRYIQIRFIASRLQTAKYVLFQPTPPCTSTAIPISR